MLDADPRVCCGMATQALRLPWHHVDEDPRVCFGKTTRVLTLSPCGRRLPCLRFDGNAGVAATLAICRRRPRVCIGKDDAVGAATEQEAPRQWDTPTKQTIDLYPRRV